MVIDFLSAVQFLEHFLSMFSLLDPGLGVGHVEMRKTVSPAEVFWISEGRQVRKQRLPLVPGSSPRGVRGFEGETASVIRIQ